MTDYMVVTNTSSYDLANAVVYWIKEGWKPLGGVSLAPYPPGTPNGYFLFAPWCAFICINGKQTWIGGYSTKEDAERAYRDMKRAHHSFNPEVRA